jgi:hypothetical protein
MSTSKWTLRPSLMRRSIQGARAAGIEIAQINVAPDGSISIVPERAEERRHHLFLSIRAAHV